MARRPRPQLPKPPARPVERITRSQTVQTVVDPLETRARQMDVLRTAATLTREYVAGGGEGMAWVEQYATTLPEWIDDVSLVWGADIYARMRTNPVVEANFNVRRAAIVQNGASPQPAVGKDDANYDYAERISNFVQFNLDAQRRPFAATLNEMLLAMMYGHKVAELVWDFGPSVDPLITHDQLFLIRIKPKPQNATAFILDRYSELLGLAWLKPGQLRPTISQFLVEREAALAAGEDDPILPPEKFWIAVHDMENADWRGHSIGRAAFFPWWALEQVWAAYLKFLARFASPSLAGFTDPDADPPEPQGDATPETPEDQMLSQILKIANGASGAFTGKSRLEVVETKGDGAAFRFAIHELTSDVTRAMTGQILMTEVGDHMTRAASSVHQDVFGMGTRLDKTINAADIRAQVFYPLVLYNYGAEAARRFTPVCSLGQADHQDFPAYATAIADLLHEQFFAEDQYPELDNLMGVPPRDPSAWRAEMERRLAAATPPPALPAPTNSNPPAGRPGRAPATPPPAGRARAGAAGRSTNG